jgi:hypothetical protein
MLELREIEQAILANGRVDGPELRMLRRELYADDKIDRQEADFLHPPLPWSGCAKHPRKTYSFSARANSSSSFSAWSFA